MENFASRGYKKVKRTSYSLTINVLSVIVLLISRTVVGYVSNHQKWSRNQNEVLGYDFD
jgi:hypothetical protein